MYSVTQLLVTYSLVTGVGFGFMYIPGVVASQEHFTRRRALATGSPNFILYCFK